MGARIPLPDQASSCDPTASRRAACSGEEIWKCPGRLRSVQDMGTLSVAAAGRWRWRCLWIGGAVVEFIRTAHL